MTSSMPSRAAYAVNSAAIAANRVLRQSTRSILLTASGDVRDAQQRGDRGVPAGLLDHAVAGVDEDDGQLGGGGAGDHVAGVLHVARGVGEDEAAGRGGEVAVGDVDGDALLALGAQAVGEQRQVGGVLAAVPADPLDGLQLVGEHRLGVVEQPARPGWTCRRRRSRRWRSAAGRGGAAGAVVVARASAASWSVIVIRSTPRCLRSSMAASDMRSSARVAPRSVSRRGGDLGDHGGHVGGVGVDGAGAGHVADGAVAHAPRLDGLARLGAAPLAGGRATCRRAGRPSRSCA